MEHRSRSRINGSPIWIKHVRSECSITVILTQFTAMLDRAIAAGLSGSYVLIDIWFTHAFLIQKIPDRRLHVIGMVKIDNKSYLVDGKRLTLKAFYKAAPKVDSNRNVNLRCIRTYLVPGNPVMIAFLRHRSKKNEWLAILSTDLTLTPQ